MGDGGEDPSLVEEWIRPAESVTIDLKESEVDLTNDQSNKLVIYTDGRKIQKSKGDSAQVVSAHWNGNQLVTDEKTPRGRKASRTLELSSDGRQFYETWRIENGRSDQSIVVRYVYDAADQARK